MRIAITQRMGASNKIFFFFFPCMAWWIQIFQFFTLTTHNVRCNWLCCLWHGVRNTGWYTPHSEWMKYIYFFALSEASVVPCEWPRMALVDGELIPASLPPRTVDRNASAEQRAVNSLRICYPHLFVTFSRNIKSHIVWCIQTHPESLWRWQVVFV